jgi:Cellulase (glycosyl hydrolase family 5)
MTASSLFLEKWKAQRAAQQRQERLAQRRAERKAEAKARLHAESLRRQAAELDQAGRRDEYERRAQAQSLLEKLRLQRKLEKHRSDQRAEALVEVQLRINATRRQERQKEPDRRQEQAARRLGIREAARQTRVGDRSETARAKSEGSDSVRRLRAAEREATPRYSRAAGDEKTADQRRARRIEEQSQRRRLRQRDDVRKKHIDERGVKRRLAAPNLASSKPDQKRRRESLLGRLRNAFRQAVRSERRSRDRQRLRAETHAAAIKTMRGEQIQREIRRAQMQEQRYQRERAAAQPRVREQRTLALEQPHRGERRLDSRVTRQREPFSRRSESLSWLGTAAQRIVDQQGKTVHLRGVNVAGLDAVSSARTIAIELALDERNLSVLTGLWGINVVRLPFYAATLLGGNESLSASEFLAGLDDLVGSISESGAFTLLAMKAPGTGPVSALPGREAITCWQLLGSRYQQEPGVLFEVYSPRSSLPEDWLHAAHHLVGAIRREHPGSLCFVGGVGGGSSLNGLPLRFVTGEPVHNVVNTVRFTAQRAPMEFDPAFAAFVRTHPVAVTEWIHSGLDLGQASELGVRLFSRYGLSWVACHWNAEPRLVEDAARHRFGETRFGMIARRALTVSLQP